MEKKNYLNVTIFFCLTIALTVSLSYLSSSFWGGKPEAIQLSKKLIIIGDMTVQEFGNKNNISNQVLKKVFGLQKKDDLQKKINKFEISHEKIVSEVNKVVALEAEDASKNWNKIRIKFGLWFLFLFIVFLLLRGSRIKKKSRMVLYITAVSTFGIFLGSDPSPMGTVKDAIALYGFNRVFFPPRMIALAIFLAIVFLANKFVCAWGCQIGTFQDLIFRINRNKKDSRGILRQYKLPFVIANTVRIAFFTVFTAVAFIWAVDMIDPIDPFKIYKPSAMTIGGIIFILILLAASLVIYRPWCHLLCPFGLVGWLFEKISLFKIKVNYETCVACETCASACPSSVMEAILKRNKVIPDCFACGTCIQVCPTKSIQFLTGKRQKPPEDKFSIKRD